VHTLELCGCHNEVEHEVSHLEGGLKIGAKFAIRWCRVCKAGCLSALDLGGAVDLGWDSWDVPVENFSVFYFEKQPQTVSNYTEYVSLLISHCLR